MKLGSEPAVTDEQLIADARNDSAAVAELYRRHYGPVFRYCVHRLFDRSVAEDVTSTVFLKMVENVDRFRGDDEDLRRWLFTVATNAANAYLRKRARRKRLLEAAARDLAAARSQAGHGPDDGAERTAELQRAVWTLKPRDQAIIVLRFVEDMKLSEIAGIVGSSPSAVQKRLSRALGRLRAWLGGRTRSNARKEAGDV